MSHLRSPQPRRQVFAYVSQDRRQPRNALNDPKHPQHVCRVPASRVQTLSGARSRRTIDAGDAVEHISFQLLQPVPLVDPGRAVSACMAPRPPRVVDGLRRANDASRATTLTWDRRNCHYLCGCFGSRGSRTTLQLQTRAVGAARQSATCFDRCAQTLTVWCLLHCVLGQGSEPSARVPFKHSVKAVMHSQKAFGVAVCAEGQAKIDNLAASVFSNKSRHSSIGQPDAPAAPGTLRHHGPGCLRIGTRVHKWGVNDLIEIVRRQGGNRAGSPGPSSTKCSAILTAAPVRLPRHSVTAAALLHE
jgi:hypothetical protein